MILRLWVGFVSVCTSAFVASAAFAASAWVPVYSDTPAYIDKLEAFGCAYPTFRALGPQTYADTQAALEAPAERPACRAPEWLLDERTILLRPSPAAELKSFAVVAPTPTTTLVGLPASLRPQFPYWENRPDREGFNLATELSIAGQAGGETWGYAYGLVPGFWTGWGRAGLGLQAYLQQAYLKVGYGFLEFTLGRYPRRFGDAVHGGLLYSAAMAPMDTFELSLRPVVPGGFLGILGPVTGRVWLASQDSTGVRGAHLMGLELGLRPLRAWELALTQVFQFGGDGVPALTVGEFAQMLGAGGGGGLAGRRHATLAATSSVWMPSRVAKLYMQLLLGSVGEAQAANPSYLVGLWFPSVWGGEVRLEGVQTASQAYRHPTWSQGLTYRGAPLGHPLGPDSQGVYLDLGLPPIATWWRAAFGALFEARGMSLGQAQVAERRLGGSLSVRRRWGLSDVRLDLVYHEIQGRQYRPGQEESVLGLGAVYRYSFL